MHLFGKSPIYASTVLECSCCKIHRYVAAPLYHQNSTVCRSKIATLLNNIGNPSRICAKNLQVLPSPEPYHVPSIQLGVMSGIRIPKPLARQLPVCKNVNLLQKKRFSLFILEEYCTYCMCARAVLFAFHDIKTIKNRILVKYFKVRWGL